MFVDRCALRLVRLEKAMSFLYVKLKEQKRMNRTQLAKLLGISNSHLRKLELGECEPTLEVLDSTARLLCLNTQALERLLWRLALRLAEQEQQKAA